MHASMQGHRADPNAAWPPRIIVHATRDSHNPSAPPSQAFTSVTAPLHSMASLSQHLPSTALPPPPALATYPSSFPGAEMQQPPRDGRFSMQPHQYQLDTHPMPVSGSTVLPPPLYVLQTPSPNITIPQQQQVYPPQGQSSSSIIAHQPDPPVQGAQINPASLSHSTAPYSQQYCTSQPYSFSAQPSQPIAYEQPASLFATPQPPNQVQAARRARKRVKTPAAAMAIAQAPNTISLPAFSSTTTTTNNNSTSAPAPSLLDLVSPRSVTHTYAPYSSSLSPSPTPPAFFSPHIDPQTAQITPVNAQVVMATPTNQRAARAAHTLASTRPASAGRHADRPQAATAPDSDMPPESAYQSEEAFMQYRRNVQRDKEASRRHRLITLYDDLAKVLEDMQIGTPSSSSFSSCSSSSSVRSALDGAPEPSLAATHTHALTDTDAIVGRSGPKQMTREGVLAQAVTELRRQDEQIAALDRKVKQKQTPEQRVDDDDEQLQERAQIHPPMAAMPASPRAGPRGAVVKSEIDRVLSSVTNPVATLALASAAAAHAAAKEADKVKMRPALFVADGALSIPISTAASTSTTSPASSRISPAPFSSPRPASSSRTLRVPPSPSVPSSPALSSASSSSPSHVCWIERLGASAFLPTDTLPPASTTSTSSSSSSPSASSLSLRSSSSATRARTGSGARCNHTICRMAREAEFKPDPKVGGWCKYCRCAGGCLGRGMRLEKGGEGGGSAVRPLSSGERRRQEIGGGGMTERGSRASRAVYRVEGIEDDCCLPGEDPIGLLSAQSSVENAGSQPFCPFAAVTAAQASCGLLSSFASSSSPTTSPSLPSSCCCSSLCGSACASSCGCRPQTLNTSLSCPCGGSAPCSSSGVPASLSSPLSASLSALVSPTSPSSPTSPLRFSSPLRRDSLPLDLNMVDMDVDQESTCKCASGATCCRVPESFSRCQNPMSSEGLLPSSSSSLVDPASNEAPCAPTRLLLSDNDTLDPSLFDSVCDASPSVSSPLLASSFCMTSPSRPCGASASSSLCGCSATGCMFLT